MNDKIAASARGALLVIPILGIPALLFVAFIVAVMVLQALSRAEPLLGSVLAPESR